MRLLRPALIALAAVAAGGLALALVALNPGFQTWAVRRALASRPGTVRASVGAVAVGIDSVRLRDVRIEGAGASLAIPALDAEVPVIPAYFSRAVSIRRLSARGWTLDLSRASLRDGWRGFAGPGPAAAGFGGVPSLVANASAADEVPPAAVVPVFQGILARLRLPVDLSLDGVDLEGDVILPAAPESSGARRAHVVIAGGGLAAGREGSFTFTVTATIAPAGAPVDTVAVDGVFTAAMGAPRSFTRVAARVHAAAKGAKFPGGVRLSAGLAAARGAFGEVYTVALAGDSKELATLQADFSDDTRRLAGTWKVDICDDDVGPFALGRALPLFDVVGQGRFDTDVALAQTHISGGLNVTADRLTVIRPELSAVGGVKLTADFDLMHRGALFRVDHLRATLAGARPILTVRGLQPFAFNLATGELQVADATRDILGIVLQGVPVEWAQPFFSNVTVTGSPLRGELVASAAGGGLRLRSRSPLSVSGVAIAHAGRPLAYELGLKLDASADYTPQGWQFDCEGQASAPAPIMAFSVRCGRLAGRDQPVKFAGHLGGDLAAMSAQPAFRFGAARAVPAGQAVLVRGRISSDFTGELAAHRSFRVKFEAANLEADPAITGEVLPAFSAEIRADSGPDGKIAVEAPLVIERSGRRSVLEVDATIVGTQGGLVFDGKIASTRLCLDDAAVLAALVWGPGLSARDGGARGLMSASLPGTIPAGITGRLVLDLKRVDYRQWAANDLGGAWVIAPGGLRIEGLHAGFADGSSFRLDATLTAVAAAQPAEFAGDVTIDDFDAGPVFRAIDPEHPPVVEGRFDVAAHITGRGLDLDGMAARLQGNAVLTSKGGVFRALRADIVEAIKQSPSRLSEAVGTVTALFGKSKEAEKFIDKQGQIAIQVTDCFREIHYDQLSLTLNRGPDLNINLAEFALISPEIRVAGDGRITYREGVPVAAQPLDLRLRIGARARTAELLKSAGLLGDSKDALGYTGLSAPIRLGGSLNDVDQGEWRDLLVKAALRKAANGLLDKLLGK